jgi:hypothetical protein
MRRPLRAAIARLTAAIATADDDSIAELVSERRALRDELQALREVRADVPRLEDRRSQRGAPTK